jgi:hypothetical protein
LLSLGGGSEILLDYAYCLGFSEVFLRLSSVSIFSIILLFKERKCFEDMSFFLSIISASGIDSISEGIDKRLDFFSFSFELFLTLISFLT